MKTSVARLCAFLALACAAAVLPLSAAETASDAGKPTDDFRVLDISERTYAGGPAVAVLLSAPLDPTVRHDDHLRISDPQEVLKSAWVLSDDNRTLYFPHVEPETEYSVTVLPSLTSADDRTLGERVSEAVTTRKITPAASFASEGLILPAGMTDGLPVVTVNVPAVDIEFFRLNDDSLARYIRWRDTTGRQSYYKLRKMDQYGELVFSGRFSLDAPENRRVIRHIPVEDIPALEEPGVYLAVMRRPGEYDHNYQTTYFLVTDIGLHARVYDKESLLAAVSLQTGRPLAGIRFRFFNKKGEVVHKGVADEQGRYRYPGKLTRDVRIVEARGDDGISVLPLDVPALDLSEFDLSGRPYRPREVFLYSPRDLYRPGERAVVSALLRDHDGRIADGRPLTAKLLRPDGREVRTFVLHPEPPGGLDYYETILDIRADAQTGLWKLQVYDSPSAKTPVGVFEYHVEEFLPERMKLDLSASPQYPGPEDAIKVDATGEYLYGAPAAGNRLESKVLVKARRELSDDLEGFLFGQAGDEDYQDFWERSDTTLDDDGQTTLTVESRWKEMKSPLSVWVIASLYESGGRPVTRNVRRTVWPADKLVGVRPHFNDLRADAGPVTFDVVRTNPAGERLPAGNLLVSLVKEDRDYYWEYSESTGWRRQYSEKTYRFLTDAMALKGGKAEPYTLHLERGQYVLSVEDPETGLTTSVRFRVGRYWWYDAGEGESAARPDKVVMTLDRPAYRPGDVIGLTVTPPHDGEALIMVEGTDPLWIGRRKVSAGGTMIQIPVSAKWDRHDLYISAVVFRPVAAEEKITPARSMGIVHLPLERSDREIALEVSAPEKIVPNGPLAATIRQTGDDPAPEAYVTVAAVDVGILNITDFETPDPFDWFFAKRRYSAESYDLYARVIENLEGQAARLRFGGDADLAGGKKPETQVKLVSLFNGPVAFDADGKAEVTFQVPDFNGRLRVMAAAFSSGRFGSAERDVTVAAPVVTQLSMPRFLSPGDKTRFTLDVHNLSGEPQNLTLDMTAEPPLVLSGGERSLSLADGEKTTLRFPATAEGAFGGGVVRLLLEGEGLTLRRDWRLGVRPGYPGIAREERKILRKGDSFMLDDRMIEDLVPSTVEASVKVSPVLPLNLREVVKGLISYPYGCLEQTTSRAWPLLYATPERIAEFHLPSIEKNERIRRLTDAIERLSTMQLVSGGFGLWNRSSPETPWLTVYVTDFLLTARDMGMNVPPDLLDKALNRLTEYLKTMPPVEDYLSKASAEKFAFAARAYAGHVLARLSRAELGDLRNLFDNHRDKAGASLPLAHLGTALAKMGDRKRSLEALTLAADKRREENGYWGDYGSPLRDLALTLPLLIHADATVEGLDDLMLDLEDRLRARRWMSTQEKYALFRAGIALSSMEKKSWEGVRMIGDSSRPLKATGDYRFTPDVADFDKGITIASGTDGILYASAAVSGYTKTPPPPESETIAIQRRLYSLKGEPLKTRTFHVGDLVVVHLEIRSEQFIPDALAADLLPAGFEIENQNLKHAVSLEDFKIGDEDLWRLRERVDLLHEEFRDDRYAAALRLSEHGAAHLFYLVRAVTPGTFSVPPPLVESMYRPEIRGIGETPAPVEILNQKRDKQAD
jgi:alpha-2-macroglobulin